MTDGTVDTENANPPAPGRAGARKQTVPTRPFPRLTFIGAFLAAAALLLGFSAPAHAQTLVSNTGQTTHGHTACVLGSEPVIELDCAQGFFTGQNTRGYDLSSIQLDTQGAPGSGTLTVTVRAATGSGRPSNAVLYTLNNPTNVGTGVQTFTAPDGTRLNRNTQYFVHITFSGSGTRPRWNLTANDNEDSGKAIGWSIGNHRYTRRSDGTGGWEGDGGVYSTSIQIRVKGNTLAPAAPNLSATPGETEVALTWDDPANNTITKYQYRRKTGAGDYGNWTDIGGSGASTDSYRVTGLTNGTVYTFGVRAKNVGGNGAAATVIATTLPAAPTSLWPDPGNGEVTLSWTDPDSDTITSHEVSTDGGGNFTDIPNSGHGQTNATGYTVPGLTNGTEYTFKLRARNISGPGRASTVTATPRAPPAAPANLSATAGDGQVTLSWTNPGDNTIRKYRVSTDGGGNFTDISDSSYTTTTHIVTGLSNGTAYMLALRAVNASGEGPASTATATPLWGAPANLSATPGNAGVTLTWTDPGDSEITKYQVSTDGGTNYTDIDGSSATTAAATVTGLTNGTEYTLALRAANDSAHGLAASVTARPLWPAPTNLAADPGDGQAILQWDTGDALITDYRVHWQATSSGATPEIVDVPAGSGNTTTRTITGLTNGTEYTFTVRAVEIINVSLGTYTITGLPSSKIATPAPVPDGPANLSPTARSQEVALTWDGSADSTITKYQVSIDSGMNFADIEGSSAATTATTVTDLTNGTAYTLAVRAVNDSGEGAAPRVTATPLWPAPTGLVAAPDSGRVVLQWDTGDSGIAEYRVLTEGGVNDINTLVAAGSGTKTTATVDGLTNGTEYTFTVQAVEIINVSLGTYTITGRASSDTATPDVGPVPAAPTGLTATARSQEVALTWTDPNNITITRYDYSTYSAQGYPSQILGSNAATTAYTVIILSDGGGITLINGTAYPFALRAVNASGDGPWATVTATPIAKPAAPANFKAKGLGTAEGENEDDAKPDVGGGEVALTWDDPDNDTINKYQYRQKRGSGAFGGWSYISGSGATTITHTVTGLSNAREYTFELRAVNSAGEGDASSDKAKPLWPAPANLVATPDHARVHLEWDRNPGIARYRVDPEETSTEASAGSFVVSAGSGSKVRTVVGVPGNYLENGTEYTFTVLAITQSLDISLPAEVNETPVVQDPPAAPTNLSATPGDRQVRLKWDNPKDFKITGYEVSTDYNTTDGSGTFTYISSSHENTTAHTVARLSDDPDTRLTNGTTYTFAVRAVNGTGPGPASAEDATPIAIPDAPTISSATPGDGQVALVWTDPGDSSITKYQVRSKVRNSDDSTYTAWTDIAVTDPNAPPTGYTVTGLTNGTEYTFAVRAVNGTGNGPASTVNARPIAVPAAPTALSATAGATEVALTWDDSDDDTITGYQVSTDGGETFADIDDTDISENDTDTLTHTVTDLTNGTEYTFAVRAENASGVGAASTVTAPTLPAAPTGLTAERGDGGGEVALTWDDPNNDTITGYQVSTDGGTTFTDIPNSAHGEANATGYTVTGLTNGTEYTFKLRAVNLSGAGAASLEATATPLWPAPENLAAAPGDGQVVLTWDTGDPGIARYKVSTYYTHINSVDPLLETFLSPSSGDQPTLVIPGLTNRTDYTFTAQAVDTSGSTDTGRPSSVDATPVPVPAAPANLSAIAANGQVVLTWDDPNDSTITKYQVRSKVKDSDDSTYTAWANIAVTDPDAPPTTYTVTGLTNGTTYTFAVRAVNGTGPGAASSKNATPIAVPDAPTISSATPGDGQVVLAWNDPSDRSITKYQVRSKVRSSNDNTYTDWANIPVTDPNAPPTGYIVTGLTNGTEYTFAVRAVNDPGNGPASTVTARPIAPPARPEISSVGPGYRKVTLTWADPNDSTITGYQVSTNGDGKFAEISGSGAGTTTHTVTGLENGTEYTLAVRAMNDVGEGDASAANATPFNNPPTGKRGEVSTYDNESYRFTMKDFAYSDDEVDTLHHVKIASPPVDDEGNDRGTLSLNGAAITSDTLPRQVTPADLEAGNLLYTPPENAHGEPFATFEFKVSDGESDSVAYAMAINVVRVYSVRFGAAAYAVEEGGDPVRVTVTLSKQAADALEIPITVTPRGRTVAADYTVTVTDPDVLDPAAGTVTLKFEEMGDTTRSFTIEATGQAQQDDNFHDVRVALGFGDLPTDVAKGAPDAATLTIIDAEGAVVQARFRRLNDEILSKHALTLADVTNRAIGARMDEACGKQAAAYTLAGGSTLYDTLRSNAPAIEDGTLTLDDVLAGSSFRLPLAAVNDGMAPGAGGPVVWGRGERQVLESTESAFAWDGTVLTGQLGIDGCLREDLLTGLALSRSIGEFDYSDGTGSSPVRGDYESRMTSVHPYLGWTSPRGLGLWATLGYGRGEIEIEDAQVRDGDPDYPVRRSDTTLKTAAAGASGPLMTDESPIAGGTTTLMLKGEASWAQVEVEGEGEGDDGLIAQQTVNANRLRLALEGSHEQALASGGSLTPSLELGLRHDGGDGITGTGIEIGGSLRYRDPAAGLTIEGNGRVLAGQSDYREWGLGGSLRLDPGAEGRGLSFSLFPAWGETASGVERLWDQDVAELASDDGTANDNVPQMRLDGELGYGFGALGGQGLLTPYGGFALADEGSRRYRIGGRFEIGSSLNLSLEGERREPADDAAADHAVMLRGQMRF